MSALQRLELFLFRLEPASGLGVMRLLLGLLLVLTHALYWPEVDTWFGPQGVVPPSVLERGWTAWRMSVYDYCDSVAAVHLAHAVGLLALVGFTVGWRTRTMAVLALLVQVSVHHANPWVQNGGDRVLRIMTLYLALSPCGLAWSVDAWLHARRRRALGLSGQVMALAPAWCRRLVQAQVIVIYTYTGVAKLQGRTWREGTALYYALSDENYARVPTLVDAVLATGAGQAAAAAGTFITSLWEALFGLLVLWAPTRGPALILGLVLHGGIWLTMSVGLFSFATTWGYLAFLRPGWVERLQGALPVARGPAATGQDSRGIGG